jgi:SAM-dependent methyltransferase
MAGEGARPTTVAEHYANHLASVYEWMAGGSETAFAQGAADVAAHLGRTRHAVDLGAGFGMHAIPLARAGARVLALDESELLLASLARNGAGLPVQALHADLTGFARHLSERPDLILCMGDTLTHLASPEQVRQLLHDAAQALAPGGTFLATFRDYRRLPEREARFIPVRSDDHRILSCVLEELPAHVRVHDVLHERAGDGWHMRVSSYLKLRLDPDQVSTWIADAGLRGAIGPGPRGMLRLHASAPG